MKKRTILFLPLVLLLALAETSQARYQVELESTYLGEGWFRYRLRSIDDPFFLFFDLASLGAPFVSRVEYGPTPSGWRIASNSLVSSGESVSWEVEESPWVADQLRPYERTFLARSAETHLKTQLGAVFTMSLATVGGYHGPATSINIVGYATCNALVPCASSEADGSPTNLLTTIQIIDLPDVEILGLVRDAAGTHGLSFRYDEASTLRLEASRGLDRWSNVAYLYGVAGVTTWTTNVSLDAYGNYFRLALVAEGQVTNLPPLDPGLSPATAFSAAANNAPSVSLVPPPSSRTVRVLRCAPSAEGVEVSIATQPGHTYEVSLLGKDATVVQSQSLVAAGEAAAVVFKIPARSDVVRVAARETTLMVFE